ncbi:hypothetical protein BU24DRAFT_82090 [Aaosphaeria arxii CBS 175.79]|uniref:Uncharacterized protein n=1 Tax=Aaosphaeria arxii CBS 175.79 TaxID=1450172 RepID=A0A6A5XA00_9PLEO|nr:uncharacterized protein BU24DRAFT_82090 [Aaosphaeria arxii CBS 175.79]KAF2009782.1 hypothetical protein BU24DRAFT_82090 [Aaosphaeria arxii CBS 175.79]
MPRRRFNGLAGKFNRLLHEEETNQLQLTGLGVVAIEAFDRQYFSKENPEPFRCPTGQCEVYLEKAGQWTQHACERHGADLYMKQPEILPSTLPHVFEERKNSLIKGRGARLREFRKIHNDWNEEGGKKRQELERGWIHQLDNDETWNTGVKGEDSKLWENFIWMMGFPTSCIE